MSSATGSILKRHWFSARAQELWSDRRTLQGWLDVEAALAQAQAGLGIIPKDAAREIAAKARVELIDAEALARDIAAVQHPFMPLIRQFAAICEGDAGGYLHWGVTTANITNTGAMLQLLESHEIVLATLAEIDEVLATLARRYRDTPMAGRTHGQHALPITFGFKLVSWLAELRRHVERLRGCAPRVFVASLGGGVGTMAALGVQGLELQERMAGLLGLGTPEIPVRTAFDRVAEYLLLLSLLATTIERIAQEIMFLQRTEIGEAAEPAEAAHVGSTTMPQKQNPARCMNIIGLTRLLRGMMPLANEAMLRSNEADASAGNVGDALLPDAATMAISVTEALRDVLAGLWVDPAAMQRNLDLSAGLIVGEAVMMKLAPQLGRQTAHEVVHAAATRSRQTGTPFRQELLADPVARGLHGAIDWDALLDPRAYTGLSAHFVDVLTGSGT
ncbi:MAG: class-II fumarase/aspartase family protein [Luteimonas sp.]